MNCPRCQMANPEGARFCLNCGNPLEAQVRVEGERKYVTVLFADVVDSTGLGERLDPEEVKRDYGVDFKVRVGINTGLAVLAAVGDEIRTEYTAMGDTTNVAARLQSAAAPGTVLISADTYHLVKQLFEFKPL